MSQHEFDRVLAKSKLQCENYLLEEYGSIESVGRGGSIIPGPRMYSPDEIYDVRENLRTIESLPKEDVYVTFANAHGDRDYTEAVIKYQMARNTTVIEAVKQFPELDRLARIDAIVAVFDK